MINFIIKTFNHFASPERRATLLQIQAEHNLPRLYPKKWVNRKWLSLGGTLIRLLKIWDSLVFYMEESLKISPLPQS